ncbi:putative F-box protein At4g22165 [Tasmannia lanceolata]|uniref:putative F-box protein At4g22165 n=1 Tax=Tasmannia lanceolata TaxID=3420 RepID=UPI004063D1A9
MVCLFEILQSIVQISMSSLSGFLLNVESCLTKVLSLSFCLAFNIFDSLKKVGTFARTGYGWQWKSRFSGRVLWMKWEWMTAPYHFRTLYHGNSFRTLKTPASNPIKTKKKIHTSSVMGEQFELPHWSISQHQLPLFMLPDKDCSESCKFFNLSDNKLYNIQIPEFHGKWCCGSSKGWLLTVDNNFNIQLLNPFSRTQIQLPSFDKFEYPQVIYEPEIRRGSRYVRKTFLSADPISTSDYIVATFVTAALRFSFYKSGDEGWTTLLNTTWGPFRDAIYYEGNFYCITNWGYVVVCDFTSNGLPKFREVSSPIEGGGDVEYIMESSGELLKVFRHYEIPSNLNIIRTSCFEVFQLDKKTGNWTEVESLGDQALFVGLNCSASLSARDFPHLKGNCIYFTDDFNDGYEQGIDNGIYNLDDDSIKPFYPNSSSWITNPIWLLPNL